MSWKRIKRTAGAALAYPLILCWVRLCIYTCRIKVRNREQRDLAARHHPQQGFILCLWHEHLLAGIMAHRHDPMAPMASRSRDGELVTRVMTHFAFATVRGSSGKGGEQALDELVTALDKGRFPAITVDGPRGPRRRIKGGVIDLSRRTGAAVLPMVARIRPALTMTRSWDKFQFPLPFARIDISYGTPQRFDADTKGLAFGEARKRLSEDMHRLEEGLV